MTASSDILFSSLISNRLNRAIHSEVLSVSLNKPQLHKQTTILALLYKMSRKLEPRDVSV